MLSCGQPDRARGPMIMLNRPWSLASVMPVSVRVVSHLARIRLATATNTYLSQPKHLALCRRATSSPVVPILLCNVKRLAYRDNADDDPRVADSTLR